MKVSVYSTFSTHSLGTVIIPILKNDTLSATLEAIGTTFGVAVERLTTDLKGDFKEITPFYSGQTRIYLLGLGEKTNSNDIISAFRSLSFTQKSRFNSGHIALDFTHSNLDEDLVLQSAVNGMLLGTYRVGVYKSEVNGVHPLSAVDAELIVFVKKDTKKADISANQGIMTAETQIRIMDLVNAAPNFKTPQYLADWAIESGKSFDFTVTSFDKKTCIEKGLKALLSVNAGSDHEPRFIIMEYKPDNAQKSIGLVGKGVTFDTGGISIKPSTNMHLMKSDMGGAAAVFGTMELVAKLKLPIHLIGIVPATENMVDGSGTRPGDVIGSYAGKTIEVIDTDAEGRLVLADGLAYMKTEFNPDVIIDLATLTGNVISALGYNAAGLFANNDALATALAKSGETTGERVWQMPMWDAYFDDMKSDVADIANLSSKPVAGAITAAKFLEFFIDKHTCWAHIDIAGMALSTTELGTHRTATAYGIRLLTDFIENWQNVLP
jgi:leucyl aminopeptidase